MPRARILTTDRIVSLKFCRGGKREEIHDGEVPNLLVRVGSRTKAFMFMARLPGSNNTTRKTIGRFPMMPLESARLIARAWNELLARGIDPTEDAKRNEKGERLLRRQTFRSALTDYIAWLPDRRFNLKVIDDIDRIKRNVLIPRHKAVLDKPLAEVTDSELADIVIDVRERAFREASLLLGLLQGFFAWTLAPARRRHYAISSNPLAATTPKSLDLWTNTRTHLLETWEIRAYWQAAEEMGFPYGPLFKMVLLTAERKEAVAGMRWSEVDPFRQLWRAPPIRVKPGEVPHPHYVPLNDLAMQVLAGIHRGLPEGYGDCVFSSTGGYMPVNSFGKAMKKLRKLAEAALREIDPSKTMRHFVLHDTRRVDRTKMSAMEVPDNVAESALAHAKKGLRRVYDQFGFLPQRRKALSRLGGDLVEVISGSRADFYDSETHVGGAWELYYNYEDDDDGAIVPAEAGTVQ